MARKGEAGAGRAVRRLVRYIQARELKPGSRLPPRDRLLQIAGADEGALRAALRALTAQGVLRRFSAAPAVVKDPGALPQMDWSIALPTIAENVHRYTVQLGYRTLASLTQAGCRCHLYVRAAKAHWPNRTQDFGRLAEDLDGGLLDALVLLTPFDLNEWARLRAEGVPLLHVGFWEESPCGVVVDMRDAVCRAARTLLERGCKRLLLVTSGAADRTGPTRAAEGMDDAAADPGARALPHVFLGALGEVHGAELARRLLVAPPPERPDGIVCTDDRTMAGLARALSEAGGYAPGLATVGCQQLPLAYAMPVLSFEHDMHELVEAAVQLTLERLADPAGPERVEWLPVHGPKEAGDTVSLPGPGSL